MNNNPALAPDQSCFEQTDSLLRLTKDGSTRYLTDSLLRLTKDGSTRYLTDSLLRLTKDGSTRYFYIKDKGNKFFLICFFVFKQI